MIKGCPITILMRQPFIMDKFHPWYARFARLVHSIYNLIIIVK